MRRSPTHPLVRRRFLGLLPGLGLALPSLSVRAQDVGVGADSIQIGQNISLQGGRNAYGAEVQAGVKACFDEVNRGGGVAGRRLVLRTLDDDNDPAKAEANARRLVQEGAFILFGSVEGGPSTAVMKVAVESNVPFFGPIAGAPGLRRPHQPLVFPVRAEHREEFRALIAHGKSLGLQRVALFHADTAVGREHLANVERLAGEARMDFGGGVPFKSDITDAQIDAAVAALTQRKVDLVINHGSATVYERLIRRARAAGSRILFWGVNSASTSLAAALGPLGQGMVFSQVVPNPRVGKSLLVRRFQAALRQSAPTAAHTYGALEGYMTAAALVAVLRATGPKPSRASLLGTLARFDTDLGGVNLRYRSGEHTGSSFVDLALVGRDGRFVQ
ncbi:MAG: ABC transporter substrate-binding protein [Rubrivivax sp.]|nr:ABC transporter substrate-binding protein [Rubrivivax sp.]